MLKRFEELCALTGTSGDEDRVAAYIMAQIGNKAEITRDKLGSVIAFKRGKHRPKNKVMLCAHMDEVGFIITAVAPDGMLRFSAVGGIDARVVIGRQVAVGDAGYIGVIGTKAVHMQSDDEKGSAPGIDKLFIDIGATSVEDALSHIALGDRAVFVSDFVAFGDGMIKAKALDDRAGCAIMMDMLDGELEYDTYFAFTVQEEVGLRGARAATYTIAPDMAIVLETTTACDIAGVEGGQQVCRLGEGTVVSYMDRSTIYDKELVALAFDTAKTLSLPCQTKTMVAGGNDAGAVHVSVGGVRTAALSMPCRYLHSASCVLKISDIEHTRKLAQALLNRMAML